MAVDDKVGRFIPIDPTENTLLDVMLILGKYGAHRVWVVQSPGGDITNVISQSAVVCFTCRSVNCV